MTVVRNEFEMGENSPDAILSQRMTAVAYEWHNYGKSTIGNRSDIERVPIDNLQVFYRKYYQPDNAVLIIAGKFEEGKALGLIAKPFGPPACAIDWFVRMGRFCVDEWPKIEPKMPRSKLRP